MLDKIKNILNFLKPVSQKDMYNVSIVLNGMTEELSQQAELITNLIAKFSQQDVKKPVENTKQENDVAFN